MKKGQKLSPYDDTLEVPRNNPIDLYDDESLDEDISTTEHNNSEHDAATTNELHKLNAILDALEGLDEHNNIDDALQGLDEHYNIDHELVN
jgi:hypothetical protein